MFTGSVCAHAREWFKSNATAFAGRRVLCGCCGNFTIETVLSQASQGPSELISNDVSLYSSVLGAYYTGVQPLSVTIRRQEFFWLSEFMADALATAGVMVVLLEMAPYSSGRTAYHKRMCEQFVQSFGRYHQQACEKLSRRKEVLHIDQYQACDVKVFVERKGREDIFLSFMPTYSGGYERLYKFLDELFDWPQRPAYELMTPERKTALLARLAEQGRYVHVDDVRRDELPVVAIVEGGHSRPVFIHSDLPAVRSEVYHRARHAHKKPRVPVLGPDQEINGDQVSLTMLNSSEFAWFRDQFLNKGITPADPQWRMGVCMDETLIGVLGWSRGYDGASYYLMCDVPAASQHYRRLSKLLCLVANTKEMGRVLRQQTGRFWTTFQTTAFTRKPVSMKYRGIFELVGRNEKDGKLTYEGRFQGTLKKAVQKWRKLEAKAN